MASVGVTDWCADVVRECFDLEIWVSMVSRKIVIEG